MALLLTVGLNTTTRDNLAILAETLGHSIIHTDSYDKCIVALGGQNCDIAIYGLQSSQKDGWPSMRSLPHLPGSPDVLAVVEDGDTEAAEYAVQSGSWDIIYIPYSVEAVKISINRCLYHRIARNAQHNIDNIKRTGIIGDSPLLERCLRQMNIVAKSDSSVLILGETGTGKELFARAVHENSTRAAHPLIVVDCTNLPPTLAESILFGHARGSFTGAVESTDGLFKQADKGTIFLDEIGELDLNIQKSLLRVIQERRFRPLSAKREVECDFRIIAATNRDLEAMVQEGRFRQDLYHRINTRTIVLPSLRDRKEDIPQLAAHYTELFCNNLGCEPKEMAAETIEAFKLYHWTGNIRELVNVVHATVLNGIAERRLYPQHLPEEIRLFLIRSKVTSQDLLNNATAHIQTQALRSSGASGISGQSAAGLGGINPANQDGNLNKQENTPVLMDFSALMSSIPGGLPTLRQVREEVVGKMEHGYLSRLIQCCNGNFSDAQHLSGLSRARLYELLQKHSLSI